MTDTPPNNNPYAGSNASKWILLGGVIIVVVSVILLFVGVFLAQRDRAYETIQDSSPPSQETEMDEATSSSFDAGNESNNAVVLQDQDASDSSHGTEIEESNEDQISEESMDPNVSWEQVELEAVPNSELPGFKFPRVYPDQTLVRVNSALRTTAVGHRIQFPIPQRGVVLFGEVTEVGGPPRARSIEGHVDDDGEKYPFNLTLGTDGIFATVATSTGSYELFANSSYGWLVPADNLDDHVDYSLPDHFIENPDPFAEHEHPPP